MPFRLRNKKSQPPQTETVDRSREATVREVPPLLPDGQKSPISHGTKPELGKGVLAAATRPPRSSTCLVLLLFFASGVFVTSIHFAWPEGCTGLLVQLLSFLGSGNAVVTIFVAYVLFTTAFKFFVSGISSEYSAPLLLANISVLKLFVSCTLFFLGGGNFASFRKVVIAERVALSFYLVPAVLYAVSDVLQLMCLKLVDPVTFAMLANLRNVLLSFLWQFIFQKNLGFGQNVAIVLTCLGCVLKELSYFDDYKATHTRFQTYVMTVCCLVSCGAATLWNEKLLKESLVPTNIQNIAFCCYSTVLSLVADYAYSFYHPGVTLLPAPGGDRFLYFGAIVAYSIQGLLTAYFLKSMGNVVRIMSNVTSVCLAVPLMSTVYGHTYKFEEVSGILVSLIGLCMYATFAAQEHVAATAATTACLHESTRMNAG
jgi:hypothetical protein